MLMTKPDRTLESIDSHQSQGCCGGDQDRRDHSIGVSIQAQAILGIYIYIYIEGF